ncbi:hypothetical protein P7C70_g3065, partial [Phenoliferia sp. Uapishka_3]
MSRPVPASSSSPTTILARWPTANSQTAIALLVRRLTGNGVNGTNSSRRAIQIRPFRLPNGSNNSGKLTGEKRKEGGRNLFVVRALSEREHMAVFVEDPTAPSRSAWKGKEKMAIDGEAPGETIFEHTKPPHTRWSCCTLGGATQSSPLATLFDAFLQRVLLGGGPSSNSPNVGAWIPRSTAVSIEGWSCLFGATGGTAGDWEIKVGQVSIKGGAAGGTTRGILIEATYLPVPYLPVGSTFVKDYVTTLLPPQAITAGEISWTSLDDERCFEAGLLEAPDPETGYYKEWEWTESHSALAYVQMFQKEGLL